MRASLIAIPVLTIALGSVAAAADIEIGELRAEIGVTPGPSSTDADTSAGSATFKSSASPCADLYAGFAGGTLHDHGFVYGLGLDVARGRFSPRGSGSGSLSYGTLMPEVRLGYGYAFTSSFHLEATPFLGYGLCSTEWPDGSGSKKTGYGTALIYGVLVGGYAKIGEGWSVGGNVGYQGGLANASVDTSAGGQTDLTIHSSGFVAHIGVGYQF